MARSGRPPLPTGIKALQGTLRPSRERERAPLVLPAGVPECPEHLDGHARDAWTLLAGQLAEVGVLSRIDGAALECLCTLWARAREADELIETEGMIIQTPFGPKKHPALIISDKSWAQFRQYAIEFGITPVARMRMRGAGKEPTDTAAADIFGIKGVVEGGKK